MISKLKLFAKTALERKDTEEFNPEIHKECIGCNSSGLDVWGSCMDCNGEGYLIKTRKDLWVEKINTPET